MENYPIDDVLNESENESKDAFEIDLCNKVSGTFYPGVPVYPWSPLGAIIKEYAAKILIDPESRLRFENKRTGKDFSDLRTTVSEAGLQPGDVLAVSDDCDVA